MKPKAFCRSIVLLVLLMCGVNLWAQNLDSLELVAGQPSGEGRFEALTKLAHVYVNTDDVKAAGYARRLYSIAKKEKNRVWQGEALSCLGEVKHYQHNVDSALFYFQAAEEIFGELHSADRLADMWINMALSQQAMYQFEDALENLHKALDYFRETKTNDRIALILLNIGSAYSSMGNMDRSISYTLQAIEIFRTLGDTVSEAMCYYNLCSGMNRYDFDPQGLEYGRKALKLFRQADHSYYTCCALQLLCRIMLNGNNDKKYVAHDDTIAKYNTEAMTIAQKLNNDYLKMRSLIVEAQLGLKTEKNLPQTHRYAREALALADTSDKVTMSTIYELLMLSSISLDSNRDSVGAYYILLRSCTDDIGTEEWKGKMTEMEVKYETEKKELKITALEKEKQLYIWLGIAGGTTLLLALAFFIIRQRLIQQKVARLEQEKQLIATQAVLDGETAERTRLARDLHDGLGGMLSVVKLNLNDMKNGVSIESEDVMRFDRVVGLLDESMRELRRVAHNMMPDSLTRYGLRVSLNDFCNSIPGAIFNHYGNDERLDPKLEVMIYRTVHELVNNALKHAGAAEIIVQMVQEPDRVSITVQDDGRGFDPAAPTSGTGLNNIRNRVGSYNGHMDVYSEPGKGTEVNVEFKLL